MNTQNDQEVTKMREEANQLLFVSEEMAKITNAQEEAKAVEFLSQVKRRWKMVDEKRKEYVKPLNEVVKKVNDDFKNILTPLETIEAIVKKGMTAYRSAEDFKAKEALRIEAEQKAKQAINEIKYGDGLTDENLQNAKEAAKAVSIASVEAPRVVKSTESGGSASFRKDWKFEIINKYEIPTSIQKEVLELAFEKGLFDQVIRQHIKAEEHEIPGVRIWPESTPIIR